MPEQIIGATSAGLAAVVVVIVIILNDHLCPEICESGAQPGVGYFREKAHHQRRPGEEQTVGFRFVKGGGTFVWPIFERSDLLSLEIITLDVNTPEVIPNMVSRF